MFIEISFSKFSYCFYYSIFEAYDCNWESMEKTKLDYQIIIDNTTGKVKIVDDCKFSQNDWIIY